MKKTALFLAILMLISCVLASCSEAIDEPKTVTVVKYVDVNTGKEIGGSNIKNKNRTTTVTPGISDYDNDGNLIVESTDNRYVYKTPEGLVIFSFSASSSSCIQVLFAVPMKDEATASQYLTENIVELMNSGKYLNVVQNGRYIVHTMALADEGYGKYLKGDKLSVSKDFSDDTKQ